jgi:transaldolase
VASVASFFLSRIDVLLDPVLEEKEAAGGETGALAGSLKGQAAIASAKLAYQSYKSVFGSPRFLDLIAAGARPQRVLWASTSTKNPAYSDVKYVEALIGPETVNTLPLETLNAYRDHGRPRLEIEQDIQAAREALEGLRKLDIEIDEVTQQLEEEGIDKFEKPFEHLLDVLDTKRADVRKESSAA